MNKTTVEQMQEINTSFMSSHLWNEHDTEIFEETQDFMELHYERNVRVPAELDTIRVLYSDGEHIQYKYALITRDFGDEVEYCEQPYVPFVDYCNGKVCNSTSGGSFHLIKKSELTYVGSEERHCKVWGSCGACGNGAINVPYRSKVYTYISNREYEPIIITKTNDYQGFGYKFKMQEEHYKSAGYRSFGGCFTNAFQVARYIQNHKLTIVKKHVKNGWCERIILEPCKDYKKVFVKDLKEFNRLAKQKTNKEFATLVNGDFRRTFFINNTQYIADVNSDIPSLDYRSNREKYCS